MQRLIWRLRSSVSPIVSRVSGACIAGRPAIGVARARADSLFADEVPAAILAPRAGRVDPRSGRVDAATARIMGDAESSDAGSDDLRDECVPNHMTSLPQTTRAGT